MALMLYVYYRANKLLNKRWSLNNEKDLKKLFYVRGVCLPLYSDYYLVVNSFNEDRYGLQWKGFSWNWYERLFANDTLVQATMNSLTIAFFAATFSTVLGALTSIALYRYKFRGKQMVGGLLFIVMMSPDIVMAVSLLVLFMILGVQLGFISLLIAHITFCLPYVVITISSRLSDFDGKMLEAAKDLGASEVTILRKIILPLALPSIISGWLLSFTISLDDVVVSSFVTSPSYEVLPLKIFSLVKTGVTPEVNALATIMIIFSLTLVVLSQLVVRKKA
ncbi:spermidine/putrescine ABC transporter membrane protein [Actinobacillus pleuropneumoniae]|nr:spermidine/putrescine ABC transporter membrane protein [Actinobacillus pleuropneumoniae]